MSDERSKNNNDDNYNNNDDGFSQTGAVPKQPKKPKKKKRGAVPKIVDPDEEAAKETLEAK